jgi:transposase
VLFVGDDWAEAHHDIEIQDETGRRLARRRLAEGVTGLAELHTLVAEHCSATDRSEAQVVVGIETDRGMWVSALIAAGYQVFAVNPMQVARYRERHVTSRAKSDTGDAHVLADLVRTDRGQHRPVAGDSDLAEAIKVLARTHQTLIWARTQQANQLRAALRQFYPAALTVLDLTALDTVAGREALALLQLAPTPEAGRRLTKATIAATLRRAGRQRHIERRTDQIQAAMRTPQLAATPLVAEAFGHTALAFVRILAELRRQLDHIAEQLNHQLNQHPDVDILRSQPGLGPILAARVIAEFGDDPDRYPHAKARKNYAGTSPVTRASGTRRVVLARTTGNKHLRDALYWQAFSALTTSPGARAYYRTHRSRGATHPQALRALANRLVGILHGCLRHHTPYNETTAWPTIDQAAA